jgi:hypothetical protein
MSEDAESPWLTFKYDRAQQWIDGWVSTVSHPELVWAWEVTLGIIDLYATVSVTKKDSLDAKRRELWYDWFSSWDGGDAHFGIHGAMQEFAYACPEGRESEQLLVVAEAYDLGTGVVREKTPIKQAEKPAPAKKPSAEVAKVLPFTVLTGGRK